MTYRLSDPIFEHASASTAAVAACDRAGEVAALDLADFTVVPSTLLQLQQEIADEFARTDIECKARGVASIYPMPVYDVSALEPDAITDPEIQAANQGDVERAVRYLDLRGLLVRPIKGESQFVSFGRAA